MEAKHARKKAIYVTRCKYIYTLNIAWTNIMCCKRDSQREGEREKKMIEYERACKRIVSYLYVYAYICTYSICA